MINRIPARSEHSDSSGAETGGGGGGGGGGGFVQNPFFACSFRGCNPLFYPFFPRSCTRTAPPTPTPTPAHCIGQKWTAPPPPPPPPLLVELAENGQYPPPRSSYYSLTTPPPFLKSRIPGPNLALNGPAGRGRGHSAPPDEGHRAHRRLAHPLQHMVGSGGAQSSFPGSDQGLPFRGI